MRTTYIRADETVACENGHDVARARRDMFRGEVCRSEDFDWLGPEEPERGAAPLCACGATFAAACGPGAILHIGDAWRSNDPLIREEIHRNGKKLAAQAI